MSEKKMHPYFPGVNDVVNSLLVKHNFKTLKHNETDNENMYIYIKPEYKFTLIDGKTVYTNELWDPDRAGIYIRDESEIKKIIQDEYLHLLKEQLENAENFDFEEPEEKDKMIQKLKTKIHHTGIKYSEIKEIMQGIRIATFIDANEMNPEGYIPLRSELLNIKTWQTEPFRPDKFYTYKIKGDFNPSIKSLNQIPQFKKLLLSAFPSFYAVTILDYFAYCYYTAFPMQKVLMMAGIHRRGKGTLVRILQSSMPEGFRRIELEKLLAPDNKFALQNIEGKKVLFDPEISRDNKRRLSFTKFNSLFGGDTLDLEEKFKISRDILGKFAGILIGNVPLFYVNDSAFLSRLLIVVTNPEPINTDIPDLDKKIWNEEGSLIVSYLLNRLKNLVKRNFKFSNQKSYSEYAKLWDLLSDSVKIFADENYVEDIESSEMEDFVWKHYLLYCEKLGLVPESKHNFVHKFGKLYPHKRVRMGEERYYVFSNCAEVVNEPKPDKRQNNVLQHSDDKFDPDNILGL